MKKVLDNALEKLPRFKQGGKALERSVFFTNRELRQFKVGKEWVSKGFFSTTHSNSSFLKWLKINPEHNVIFKVFGKNGKLIERAAYQLEEHEVLFKSGIKFIVQSINKGARHPLIKDKKVIEIVLKEK